MRMAAGRGFITEYSGLSGNLSLPQAALPCLLLVYMVAGSKWELNMKIFSLWKTSGGFTWLQI